jgi:hypothetical protein
MVAEAQAAIGLARVLCDEPDRDDELTVTLYWQTSPEALAHLAAALVRQAPGGGATLRRLGICLALQEAQASLSQPHATLDDEEAE